MPRDTRPVDTTEGLVRWKEGDGISWSQYRANDGTGLHAIPENDDMTHKFSGRCPCHPSLNRNDVWVHNAFDCREEYMLGWRKMN